MSAHDFPTDDPGTDAAARPFRQRLWERVPKWARIGLISAAVVVVIHVVAGIRIWYGLQDPAAVIAIQRNPTNMITYRVEPIDPSSDPLNWLENMAIGLRGRSVDDVQGIDLGCEFDGQPFEGPGPTDKDLEYVAEHFPKLQTLQIMNGTCTTKGLMALKACRELRQLFIHNMDIDDGLADLLPHLPELYDLHVAYTNTGDGLVTAATQHPKLVSLDVQGTNATQTSLDAWAAVNPPRTIQPTTARTGLDSFLRWSDGSATWFFMYPALTEIQGPYDPSAAIPWPRRSLESESYFAAYLTEQKLESYADGKYRMIVSLVLTKASSTNNDRYELVVSIPVEFDVLDGEAKPSRVEIRVPITRDEAVRRIPRDDGDAVDQWVETLLKREGVTPVKRRKIPRNGLPDAFR